MKTLLKSKIFLIGGDIALFFIAFLISIWVRQGVVFEYEYFMENLIKFGFLLIIWLAVFYTFDLYHLNKFQGRLDYFKKQVAAIVVLTVFSTLFFYWVPIKAQVTPKTILLIFAVSFLILWLLFRWVIFHLLSKTGETYLIIGGSSRARQLFKDLCAPSAQKKKIFIYSDTFLMDQDCDFAKVIEPPVENLIEAINTHHIDKIIIDAEFPQTHDIINQLFSHISKINSEFYELNDFVEKFHRTISLETLDKKWFIYNLKPSQKIYLAGKRAIDLSVGIVGAAILTPLYLIIGASIKLDSKGPVIYKQQRMGQNNKVFYIYKFRTMEHTNEQTQLLASANDKRITSIGKILRKTHLDEFPQFINILKGDISIVGPRPEQPQIVEELSLQIPFYNQRHLIKPGVTGWAQINYPYCATLEEHQYKLRYDLYYLKHKSFIFDIKIIIKTLNDVLFSKGR
ncbi:MAG TPA: exopolysaccharide biosynthesis polyprenyl glycosylphosphotransferase [Candidatus Bipolaricaulota bacterium]|nr:exopolysaccharide biosynthesis polyprenyl glycosylphosphotransferase [Candidatus Bipolaricaulota bacterium]